MPDSYLSEDDYNDDSENWYYSDKDGKLVAGEMKTINGKKYAFNNSGVMLDGFRFIKLASDNKTISAIANKDTKDEPTVKLVSDSDYKFDTTDGFKKHASSWEASDYKLYYFGSGDDGSMKINKQNVDIDGDSHSFLFNKSGSFKGAGKTGIDNKKYYQSGMLMAADKDDKYAVVKVNKTGSNVNYVQIMTTDEFLKDMEDNFNVVSVVTDTNK